VLRCDQELLAKVLQLDTGKCLLLLEFGEEVFGLAAILAQLPDSLNNCSLPLDPTFAHDGALFGCGKTPLKNRAIHARG